MDTVISGRRYYSPSQGRFLGRDPKQEPGGLNLYSFCLNNGINRWDYLGMVGMESGGIQSKPWTIDGPIQRDGSFERQTFQTIDGEDVLIYTELIPPSRLPTPDQSAADNTAIRNMGEDWDGFGMIVLSGLTTSNEPTLSSRNFQFLLEADAAADWMTVTDSKGNRMQMTVGAYAEMQIKRIAARIDKGGAAAISYGTYSSVSGLVESVNDASWTLAVTHGINGGTPSFRETVLIGGEPIKTEDLSIALAGCKPGSLVTTRFCDDQKRKIDDLIREFVVELEKREALRPRPGR